MKNPTQKRLDLIIAAGKYSEAEVHDISSVLVFLRDTDDDIKREKAERLLNLFILKKKLGEPVSFKKMKLEAGFD